MTTTRITPIQTPSPTTDEADRKQLRKVRKVISSKTFATLATTSPAGRPHVSGVLYDEADGALWVHTMRSSRKARSIAANPHVAVTIPFRKLPVGPPYTVQFQATAELVELDDPEVVDLIAAGALETVSAHGALDEPDGVFVRITPGRTVHSYGLGANPIDLVRDPLHTGARTVHLDDGGTCDEHRLRDNHRGRHRRAHRGRSVCRPCPTACGSTWSRPGAACSSTTSARGTTCGGVIS